MVMKHVHTPRVTCVSVTLVAVRTNVVEGRFGAYAFHYKNPGEVCVVPRDIPYDEPMQSFRVNMLLWCKPGYAGLVWRLGIAVWLTSFGLSQHASCWKSTNSKDRYEQPRFWTHLVRKVQASRGFW